MIGLAALARLTWRRRLRGRAIWVSLLFMAGPTVMALVALDPYRPPSTVWNEALGTAIGLLAILPPLHLAGAIGDEVDSHTYTYLWSRPIPRWSVLVAKLLALVPLVALSIVISVVPAWPISGIDAGLFFRCVGALVLGALATSAASAAIGTIVPRYPLPASIAFLLLFDITLGAIPFAGRNLSVSYHVRNLSGVFGEASSSAAEALIWCGAITALWTAIAIRRVSRAEYARAD